MAGTGRIYRRGQIYYIAYRWDGREYRETSRSSDWEVAARLLATRLGERRRGRDAPAVPTFDALAAWYLDDYGVRQLRTLDRPRARRGAGHTARGRVAVRGTLGWGYRLARTAEAGDPDWHYARLTWRDGVAAGVIDHDTIEMARHQLPVAVFQQLYEARALDGDTHPIGLEAIAACATLDAALDTAPIVWGWDLGRSQSWTAGIALDQHGHVCRVERFKRDWEKTLERIVAATGSAVALVDATHGSVGDPIVEFLQRDGPAGRFLPFGK